MIKIHYSFNTQHNNSLCDFVGVNNTFIAYSRNKKGEINKYFALSGLELESGKVDLTRIFEPIIWAQYTELLVRSTTGTDESVVIEQNDGTSAEITTKLKNIASVLKTTTAQYRDSSGQVHYIKSNYLFSDTDLCLSDKAFNALLNAKNAQCRRNAIKSFAHKASKQVALIDKVCAMVNNVVDENNKSVQALVELENKRIAMVNAEKDLNRLTKVLAEKAEQSKQANLACEAAKAELAKASDKTSKKAAKEVYDKANALAQELATKLNEAKQAKLLAERTYKSAKEAYEKAI